MKSINWDNLINVIIRKTLTLGAGSTFRDLGRFFNVRAAGTYNLTANQDNRIVLLNSATGATIVLPAATGSGVQIEARVGTALSSGSYILRVSNPVDVLVGGLVDLDAGATTLSNYQPGASDDTVTLISAGTAGGKVGDVIEFLDIKAGFWSINGRITASAVKVTPFSSTV